MRIASHYGTSAAFSPALYDAKRLYGHDTPGPRAVHRELKGEPMTKLVRAVAQFLREEDGPTAVEYAVMLALIIVVCITAITTLGTRASCSFSNTSLNIAAGNSSGGS
jgi:pilus assembly protein Flp/PilA